MVKGVEGFDGRLTEVDFAVGSVLGTRSFQINDEFKLTGVTFNEYEYSDGENTAECKLCEMRIELQKDIATLKKELAKEYDEVVARSLFYLEQVPDTMSDCGHGFWAYFNKVDEFQTDFTISAVVEGYGEVIVGEKGFRSSKLRILALEAPKSVESMYKLKRSIAGFVFFALIMAALVVLPFFVEHSFLVFDSQNLFVSVSTNLLPKMALWMLIFKFFGDIKQSLKMRKMTRIVKDKTLEETLEQISSKNKYNTSLRDFSALLQLKTILSFDKVRLNYPSAKIFSSKKEMLKAYPGLAEQKSKWAKA